MVVTRHHQHPARGGCAVGVAMFQRICRPVHAGDFAIPKAEHCRAGLVCVGFDLLRADHLGGTEFFIHGRQKFDACVGDQFLIARDLHINPAHGGATVARHIAAGIKTACTVTACLIQRDAHDRLGSGQENPALGPRITILQFIVFQDWRLVRHHSPGLV
jgi:hypothetical protein